VQGPKGEANPCAGCYPPGTLHSEIRAGADDWPERDPISRQCHLAGTQVFGVATGPDKHARVMTSPPMCVPSVFGRREHTGFDILYRIKHAMTHVKHDRARATLGAARDFGIADVDLDDLPIVDLLNGFKQRGFSITQTVLTIRDHAPVTNGSSKTLSMLYGRKAFPYHTDYAFLAVPPRFIILANESPYAFVRPTYVAWFSSLSRATVEILRGASWIVANKRGAFPISSTQLLQRERMFRWDATLLVPYNDAARESMMHVPKQLELAKHTVSWKQRSAIVIDNWYCAHARGNVVPTVDDAGRQLIRYEVWGHA
jgi:hypothetical protein